MGCLLEKSDVVSVWRLSASFPGQSRAPRAGPAQPSREIDQGKRRGMEIPFPERRTRGPRQTVPGDSCGVCHRGEPMGVSVGENAEGSVK